MTKTTLNSIWALFCFGLILFSLLGFYAIISLPKGAFDGISKGGIPLSLTVIGLIVLFTFLFFKSANYIYRWYTNKETWKFIKEENK